MLNVMGCLKLKLVGKHLFHAASTVVCLVRERPLNRAVCCSGELANSVVQMFS